MQYIFLGVMISFIIFPIPPPEEQAVLQNETFMMADKLDWT